MKKQWQTFRDRFQLLWTKNHHENGKSHLALRMPFTHKRKLICDEIFTPQNRNLSSEATIPANYTRGNFLVILEDLIPPLDIHLFGWDCVSEINVEWQNYKSLSPLSTKSARVSKNSNANIFFLNFATIILPCFVCKV